MRVYWIALFLILILAFTLRFYDLGHIPPGIHGDEAEWGLIEQKVNRGEYTSFFSLGNIGQYFDFSILSYKVQGLFLRIFGDTVFGIRSSSAFAGFLTIIFFIILAKLIFQNKLIILLIALSFATSHYHIAYSRLALSNIWTPLFACIIIYFLYRTIKEQNYINAIIAGIFLGLSLYFHHTTKALPIIVGVFTFIFIIQNRKKILVFKKIFFIFITAGVVFLPQGIYYFSNPGTYSPRLNEVSVFNHLDEYYKRYNTDNVPSVLFWQFINTLKVFNFGGDIGFYFYGYQKGLLAPIIGFFTIGGLLISFFKYKSNKSQLLLIWFFVIILFGGTITIDPPSSQRLVGLIPVLFLFAGITIEEFLRYKIRFLKLILIMIFVINGFWDYKIYFNDYIRSKDGWAQREPATQIAYYLKNLGLNWKVYMLRENTWLYFNHGTIRFINPELEGVDIDNSEQVIPISNSTSKNIVYIMPPNSPSMSKIKYTYPYGKEQHFFNGVDNSPSFWTYEIKRIN